MWDQPDENGECGGLDKEEFKIAARKLGIELMKDEIDLLFGLLDPDEDGSISYDELAMGMKEAANIRKEVVSTKAREVLRVTPPLKRTGKEVKQVDFQEFDGLAGERHLPAIYSLRSIRII